MAAESPKRTIRYNHSVVRPHAFSDKSVMESVVDFISDVVPQAYCGNQKVEDKEKIQWVRFENTDGNDLANNPDFSRTENKGVPLLLILGYSNGVQIWNITPSGEAEEVLSLRQGPVRVLRILPTPTPVFSDYDPYSVKRPLVAVCDTSSAGQPYCSVKFVSLRTGDEIYNVSFKTFPVHGIECNKRVIVVVFQEKLCVFDACSLKQLFEVTGCFPSTGPNYNPVALGTRWLAYADKRLVPVHQSCGGMSGDGAQSYAATVISAAKGAFKGLTLFGEAIVSNVTGAKAPTTAKKVENVVDNGHRPGIVSIIDLQNVNTDKFCVSEDHEGEGLIAHFHAHANEPVAAMSFDVTGRLLLTACKLGHNFHVFRLMAHPCSSSLGAVHHLYTLHRGDTTAKVIDMSFSHDSRWVTVNTHRGTTHVFPITPYGGTVNLRTHCSPRVVNRASRYHKSAGLDESDYTTSARRSPVLSGSPGSADVHAGYAVLLTALVCRMKVGTCSNGMMSDLPLCHIVRKFEQVEDLYLIRLGQYDNYPSLIRQNAINNSLGNPRLPPFPHSTTVYPLAQIKQPLNLSTSIGGTKTQSPTHSAMGTDNMIAVSSCFCTPRLWVGGSPNLSVDKREERRAVDSLFIMSQMGTLVEYILEPKAKPGTEKISDESMLDVCVTGYTQWHLQRSKTTEEVKPPLANNNPLMLAADAVRTGQPTSLQDLGDLAPVTRHDSKDSLSSDHSSKDTDFDEQWLSQVEIFTHVGPTRRLWMGPQFSFKTYQNVQNTTVLSSNSSALLSQSPEANVAAMDIVSDECDLESLKIQPMRSSPVAMPNSRPAYRRQTGSDSTPPPGKGSHAPLHCIEAGSFDQSPNLCDVYTSWAESTVAKQPRGSEEEEDRIKETLAEAMLESPLKEGGPSSISNGSKVISSKDLGKSKIATTVGKSTKKSKNPPGNESAQVKAKTRSEKSSEFKNYDQCQSVTKELKSESSTKSDHSKTLLNDKYDNSKVSQDGSIDRCKSGEKTSKKAKGRENVEVTEKQGKLKATSGSEIHERMTGKVKSFRASSEVVSVTENVSENCQVQTVPNENEQKHVYIANQSDKHTNLEKGNVKVSLKSDIEIFDNVAINVSESEKEFLNKGKSLDKRFISMKEIQSCLANDHEVEMEENDNSANKRKDSKEKEILYDQRKDTEEIEGSSKDKSVIMHTDKKSKHHPKEIPTNQKNSFQDGAKNIKMEIEELPSHDVKVHCAEDSDSCVIRRTECVKEDVQLKDKINPSRMCSKAEEKGDQKISCEIPGDEKMGKKKNLNENKSSHLNESKHDKSNVQSKLHEQGVIKKTYRMNNKEDICKNHTLPNISGEKCSAPEYKCDEESLKDPLREENTRGSKRKSRKKGKQKESSPLSDNVGSSRQKTEEAKGAELKTEATVRENVSKREDFCIVQSTLKDNIEDSNITVEYLHKEDEDKQNECSSMIGEENDRTAPKTQTFDEQAEDNRSESTAKLCRKGKENLSENSLKGDTCKVTVQSEIAIGNMQEIRTDDYDLEQKNEWKSKAKVHKKGKKKSPEESMQGSKTAAQVEDKQKAHSSKKENIVEYMQEVQTGDYKLEKENSAKSLRKGKKMLSENSKMENKNVGQYGQDEKQNVYLAVTNNDNEGNSQIVQTDEQEQENECNFSAESNKIARETSNSRILENTIAIHCEAKQSVFSAVTENEISESAGNIESHNKQEQENEWKSTSKSKKGKKKIVSHKQPTVEMENNETKNSSHSSEGRLESLSESYHCYSGKAEIREKGGTTHSDESVQRAVNDMKGNNKIPWSSKGKSISFVSKKDVSSSGNSKQDVIENVSLKDNTLQHTADVISRANCKITVSSGKADACREEDEIEAKSLKDNLNVYEAESFKVGETVSDHHEEEKSKAVWDVVPVSGKRKQNSKSPKEHISLKDENKEVSFSKTKVKQNLDIENLKETFNKVDGKSQENFELEDDEIDDNSEYFADAVSEMKSSNESLQDFEPAEAEHCHYHKLEYVSKNEQGDKNYNYERKISESEKTCKEYAVSQKVDNKIDVFPQSIGACSNVELAVDTSKADSANENKTVSGVLEQENESCWSIQKYDDKYVSESKSGSKLHLDIKETCSNNLSEQGKNSNKSNRKNKKNNKKGKR